MEQPLLGDGKCVTNSASLVIFLGNNATDAQFVMLQMQGLFSVGNIA